MHEPTACHVVLTRDDLDQLIKLRVIVARFGEMDLAGWWNTKGQLGPYGTATLQRGMPRTHYVAQARSVFAVSTAPVSRDHSASPCVSSPLTQW